MRLGLPRSAHQFTRYNLRSSRRTAVTFPKAAAARAKLPLPQYLPDLDLTGSGTPFKQVAEEKAPKSRAQRYFVETVLSELKSQVVSLNW